MIFYRGKFIPSDRCTDCIIRLNGFCKPVEKCSVCEFYGDDGTCHAWDEMEKEAMSNV
jgi:hypothetical protein